MGFVWTKVPHPTSEHIWPDSCCTLKGEALNLAFLVRLHVCIFPWLHKGDWDSFLLLFSCWSSPLVPALFGGGSVANSSFLDPVAHFFLPGCSFVCYLLWGPKGLLGTGGTTPACLTATKVGSSDRVLTLLESAPCWALIFHLGQEGNWKSEPGAERYSYFLGRE